MFDVVFSFSQWHVARQGWSAKLTSNQIKRMENEKLLEERTRLIGHSVRYNFVFFFALHGLTTKPLFPSCVLLSKKKNLVVLLPFRKFFQVCFCIVALKRVYLCVDILHSNRFVV